MWEASMHNGALSNSQQGSQHIPIPFLDANGVMMAGTHILTQICRYQIALAVPNAVIAEIDRSQQ